VTEFSFLEIQFIRSSLVTKTDGEIAELLERPLAEIREKITELTGTDAPNRDNLVLEARREREQKKKQRKRKPTPLKKEGADAGSWKKKHQLKMERIRQFEEKRKKELAGRTNQQVFKNKKIDWSQMKSVRVNRSTFVYVDKNMPEAEAIRKYEENKEHYKKNHLPTSKKNTQ